jgi:hypothetical protein
MVGNTRSGQPQEWQGWTLCTADGADVGTIVGRFERGPHADHLRVHRLRDGVIAVFAIPLHAISAAGSGTLRLTASRAEISEWLAYVVRRYSHNGASGDEPREFARLPRERSFHVQR